MLRPALKQQRTKEEAIGTSAAGRQEVPTYCFYQSSGQMFGQRVLAANMIFSYLIMHCYRLRKEQKDCLTHYVVQNLVYCVFLLCLQYPDGGHCQTFRFVCGDRANNYTDGFNMRFNRKSY